MAPLVTLITGCSSGIGLATAAKLARDPQKSFLVYATMRNLSKKGNLEKAAGDALNDTLFIRELDITKEDQIVSNVKYLMDQHGTVDILVNNAAFGDVCALEDVPMSHIRQMTDTNLLGTIGMTREVIPIMKRQRSGRIINVSSVCGIIGFPYTDIYVATKFALEGFTESLNPVLRCYNVWISTICPGPVLSSFQENMGLNKGIQNDAPLDAIPEPETYSEKLLASYLRSLKTLFASSSVQSSEDIADVILKCVNDSQPRFRYATNEYMNEQLKMRFGDGGGEKAAETWFNLLKSSS